MNVMSVTWNHPLLLKEQMMTSVRKTLKRWSDQCKTDRFLVKFALKITTKSAVFLTIAFQPSLPQKFPQNSREIVLFFRDFVPKNPAKFDFFFRDLSEALSLCPTGPLNWAGLAHAYKGFVIEVLFYLYEKASWPAC